MPTLLPLTLAYWLHLIATILWVGGLALIALVVWPVARAALGDGPALAGLMLRLQQRFAPLSWLSLAVLVVTGLIQMSASDNYDGLLQISNPWSAAMLAKHLAIGGMVGLGVAQQWLVLPELGRLAVLRAHGRETPKAAALQRREVLLTRLSLALGVIVLGLTALARVL
jgi:uncharacterized membrane protein